MQVLNELYKDIRTYLIQTLPSVKPESIIRSYQNNAPLPKDGIVMNFRHSGTIDRTSAETQEPDKLFIFNSVRGFMQLDFYGKDAYDRAQEISTLWDSGYTTSVLQNCVPLNYSPYIRDLSFVNDSGLYEPRFMLDLELQFNTKYEKKVNIVTDISETAMESIDAI